MAYLNLPFMTESEKNILLKAILLNEEYGPTWDPRETFEVQGLPFPFQNHKKITLSHKIVKRERLGEKSGYRYEVEMPEIEGEGLRGSVQTVIATIAINEDGSLTVTHKPRVIKTFEGTEEKPLCFKNVTNEYKALQDIPHLKIKKPIHDKANNKAYLVMKKQPGRTLEAILDDLISGKLTLSVEQKLFLSLVLLKALKKQVTSRDRIHFDIKPGNILVDLSDPIRVNIVDYGSAVQASDPLSNHATGGTPYFMAPEAFDTLSSIKKMKLGLHQNAPYFTKTSVRSDVYSMARILGIIWAGNYVPAENAFDLRTQADNFNYDKLFDDAPHVGLNDTHAWTIVTTLNNMLAPNPDNRIDVDVAIANFEEILLQHHLALIKKEAANLKLKGRELFQRGYSQLGGEILSKADSILRHTSNFQQLDRREHKAHAQDYLNEYHQLMTKDFKDKLKQHRALRSMDELNLSSIAIGFVYGVNMALRKLGFFSNSKTESEKIGTKLEQSEQALMLYAQ